MNPKLKGLSLRGCFGLAAVVLVLDQLTKIWAVDALRGEPPIVLIPRFLQLIYRTNTGAAWSVFEDHPMILAGFATIVAAVIAGWAIRVPEEEYGLRWPLGLIFGGAVGNLVDRYRLGHVIDFIDAHWDESYHFPTFNVADSGICVGMGLLIVLYGFADPEKEQE